MDSQTRITVGVIGVLLVLFLAILYSRFSGEGAVDVELNIHSQQPLPTEQLQDAEPQVIQPTVVNPSGTGLPQEAFNPLPAPDPLLPDRLLTPAEYEARQLQQWPVPSPSERSFPPREIR